MYLNEITEDIYKELNDTSITNEHKRNLIKLLLKDHDEENPFIITKEICLDFLFFSCLKAIESNCSLNFLNTLLNFIIEQCLNPSDNFVQNLKELFSKSTELSKDQQHLLINFLSKEFYILLPSFLILKSSGPIITKEKIKIHIETPLLNFLPLDQGKEISQ